MIVQLLQVLLKVSKIAIAHKYVYYKLKQTLRVPILKFHANYCIILKGLASNVDVLTPRSRNKFRGILKVVPQGDFQPIFN